MKKFFFLKTQDGRKRIAFDLKERAKPDIKLGYTEQDKKHVKKAVEGIKIPETVQVKKDFKITDETYEARNIDMKYPLIPHSPGKNEMVFAYAHIFFDPKVNELVYNVVEPKTTEEDNKIIEEIKEYIQEKIDVNFSQIRRVDAVQYITDIFDKALQYFKKKVDKNKVMILKYYIFRDFIGLDYIEPILRDKNIEDISCDGINIPIYVYHRDPRIGSLRTNIVFRDKEQLDSFVNKIAEKCGRSISVANPLLDGTLPDGSRVQATLGSDIARHGSNFTIRMFTEKPLTPTDMIRLGTCDIRMMAYFWFLIEHGSSFLISGGTATGKTSLLNVLSMFIKASMKIVSIEDTAELRLPHPHWVPEVARTPVSEEGKIDMFELLRESLRQRPDYIIVGEVRGKEAYVLFQQMAIGHPGLSTIHSESFSKLLDRLTSPPINLAPNLLENLDLIIFIKRVKIGRRYIRRVNQVVEVVGYDRVNKVPVTNVVFDWTAKNDSFIATNNSAILKKIMENTGLDERDVQEEIKKRAKVIEWFVKKGVHDYKRIGAVINSFYTSPEYVLERIEAGL